MKAKDNKDLFLVFTAKTLSVAFDKFPKPINIEEDLVLSRPVVPEIPYPLKEKLRLLTLNLEPGGDASLEEAFNEFKTWEHVEKNDFTAADKWLASFKEAQVQETLYQAELETLKYTLIFLNAEGYIRITTLKSNNSYDATDDALINKKITKLHFSLTAQGFERLNKKIPGNSKWPSFGKMFRDESTSAVAGSAGAFASGAAQDLLFNVTAFLG